MPHPDGLRHTPHCMMSFRVVYSMEPLSNYTGVNLSLFRLRNIFQRIKNQIWKAFIRVVRVPERADLTEEQIGQSFFIAMPVYREKYVL
jgi:hypothetical protein